MTLLLVWIFNISRFHDVQDFQISIFSIFHDFNMFKISRFQYFQYFTISICSRFPDFNIFNISIFQPISTSCPKYKAPTVLRPGEIRLALEARLVATLAVRSEAGG